MTAIEQLGTYVPRFALAAETVEEAWGQFHGAGIKQTAVPGGDEDTLTMAYEAAAVALEASERSRSELDRLIVATTTPPLEEEAMGSRLRSTLGLETDVRSRQLTGSTRAGVEGILTAAEAPGTALVIASDSPRGVPDSEYEQAGGAGAVAAIVGDEEGGEVTDHAARVDAVPGTRFRPAGSDETDGLGIATYDRNAYSSAVGAVGTKLGVEDVGAVALQAPNGKLPYRAAGALGVDTELIAAGTNVSEIGDTGAASPLFGLATAADGGAASALLIGYGSGDATALAIEGQIPVASAVEGIVPGERRSLSYGEYLRMRGEITTGEPEGGGAYVSVPSWKRTMPQRHRLVAGVCTECGALTFPPEGVCTECGTFESFDHVELPGTGTVEAATKIGAGGAPPEFVEQQAKSGAYTSAVVALDGPGGETVSVPVQVLGDQDVGIDDRVTATIRRIYTQEDVIRYGFKMRPLTE